MSFPGKQKRKHDKSLVITSLLSDFIQRQERCTNFQTMLKKYENFKDGKPSYFH
jgi:hypothetical protein